MTASTTYTGKYSTAATARRAARLEKNAKAIAARLPLSVVTPQAAR